MRDIAHRAPSELGPQRQQALINRAACQNKETRQLTLPGLVVVKPLTTSAKPNLYGRDTLTMFKKRQSESPAGSAV
ncbi:MAG: hypothetical protein ACI9MC_000491 [Kiritimatiellia bacterium]|jgi:hypothetical protein